MKTLRIVSIIILSLVALSLTFMLVYFTAYPPENGFFENVFSGGEKRTILDEKYSIAEIDNLDVSLKSLDCNFYPSEDDKIRVLFKSNQSGDKCSEIEVKSENNTLKITQKSKIQIFFFGIVSEYIEIYLPSKDFIKLKLELTSGDLSTTPLTASKIDISGTSGNLDIEGIDCSEYNVKTSSGDIHIGLIKGSGKINLTSGNIDIAAMKGENHSIGLTSGDTQIGDVTGIITVGTTSGNIGLGNLNGGGQLETTSGDIAVKAEQLSGDFKITCFSGTIMVHMSKKLSCFVKTEVFSGDTNFNFPVMENNRQKSGTVGTNPIYTLTAKTTSGDIMMSVEQE